MSRPIEARRGILNISRDGQDWGSQSKEEKTDEPAENLP